MGQLIYSEQRLFYMDPLFIDSRLTPRDWGAVLSQEDTAHILPCSEWAASWGLGSVNKGCCGQWSQGEEGGSRRTKSLVSGVRGSERFTPSQLYTCPSSLPSGISLKAPDATTCEPHFQLPSSDQPRFLRSPTPEGVSASLVPLGSAELVAG